VPGTLVLGIDPGTRVVGYGAVRLGGRRPRCVAAGVLRTRALGVPERLGEIAAAWLSPGTEDAYKHASVQQGQREGQFKVVALAYKQKFTFDLDAHIEGGRP